MEDLPGGGGAFVPRLRLSSSFAQAQSKGMSGSKLY